jgi:ATP-binding cassette, subfamily B, bacterial MsbA
MKEARTIRLLLPLLGSYGWGLPAVVLLGIAASLAESIGLSLFVPLFQNLNPGSNAMQAPEFLQRFFDFVLARLPYGDPLPRIVGLIIVLTLCKGVLTFSHSLLTAHLSSKIAHLVRTRLFAKLMAVRQQTLDQVGSGRLVNLLATDSWHTGDAVSLTIGLVVNLCSIAVFASFLMMLSWKLTLLVVIGVGTVSAVIQIVTSRARRLGQDGVRANAVLSEHMLDALEGIREIQMFGLRSAREKLFDAVSRGVKSIYFRLDLLHRAVSPLSEVLYVCLLLGILLVASGGHGSIPAIVVFLLVLYRLQPQIRQLDASRLSLVAMTTPVEEVSRFLAAGAEMRDSSSPPHPVRHAIDFDAVCFSYDDPAGFRLDRISFRIPAGKTTAIVGRSGSGKSTLVKLLCRFYEPRTGSIHVDGAPLDSVEAADWRENIAWVSQDAHMFRASVRENIRYGRLGASDEEVTAAAIRADADLFITHLPEGYDTKIGSGGTELSSGQVQRIALARAFVRRAPILILDEATNALDSLSEEFIQSRLRRDEEPQTVIVISHRLSSVKKADYVIVLENGCIADQGTPAELFARRGLFARMRELQHVE